LPDYHEETTMVRKLKDLAGEVTDNQLAATIRESAHQIWLAGLGAFVKAQQEGTKVFEALVKEGETIQTKTLKVAEEKVVELSDRATGTWDKLEQVFENRVARALHSLGVPTRQDLHTLSKRVAELTDVVQKLGDEGKAPASSRHRAAHTSKE
jgi:poly(hydroxyalkanoate) granule-associated protein